MRAFLKRLESFINKTVHRLWQRVDRYLNARLRRYITALMAILFVAATFYLLSEERRLVEQLQFLPLAGLAALVPPGLCINALRYQVLGAIIGTSVTFRHAITVVISANAANLLPIPGSLWVRAGGLSQKGKNYTGGLAVNVSGSFVWIGTAALFSALAATLLGLGVITVILALVGIGFLLVGFLQIAYWRPSRRLVGALLATNLMFSLVSTARFALALSAIGFELELVRPALLSTSGPLGVATALTPGGLGISEGLAVVLGAAVNISLESAFTAALVIRAVSLAVMAFVALILSISYRRNTPGQKG